jgi:hypothetical protein
MRKVLTVCLLLVSLTNLAAARKKRIPHTSVVLTKNWHLRSQQMPHRPGQIYSDSGSTLDYHFVSGDSHALKLELRTRYLLSPGTNSEKKIRAGKECCGLPRLRECAKIPDPYPFLPTRRET